MLSFENQIQDLVPNNLAQAKIEDILNSSAKAVMDSLPNMILLPYANTATTSSSEYNIKNKRILSVIQANYMASPKEDTLEHWLGDADSIHYADATSPMFVIKSSGVLKCYPTGTEATVNYIGYPVISKDDTTIGSVNLTGVTSVAATEVFSKTGHGLTDGDTVSLSNFTQSVEVNGLTAVVSDSSSGNTFKLVGVNVLIDETTGGSVAKAGGFPNMAEYAVVLNAAIKVAQSLLGELIHTEEDVEIASSMQLEIASLQSLYTAEMQRLIGGDTQ